MGEEGWKVSPRPVRQSRVVFLVIALAAIAGGLFAACGGSSPPSAVRQSTEESTVQVVRTAYYDWSTVITIGNHSWVPLYLDGSPSNNPSFILNTLKAFEDAHPDLEVPPGGWRIEKQQQTGGYANSVSAQIFGLWVDHRPKNK